MKFFYSKLVTVFIVSAGLIATGCGNLNKTQKGVIIGAGAGGAVGAGVGKAAGNTALGAIIGAAVGGATGGIIGRKMDKQAEEMAKIPGAEVKRVGEGINVTFESGVLFAVDQSTLNGDAQTKIKDLATILNKNPETYILIEGHTDNSGSNSHNMALSERRSKAVSEFLKNQSIATSRLKTAWYGETQPKVANDTESNKAQNRRVEFAIYANEKLVEQAKAEAGNQ
ncbi:MAG: OmpA family protein [Chitinophagaceae bacterium]|nr:OmpA family protein [Chitinophagaceae bacterium]